MKSASRAGTIGHRQLLPLVILMAPLLFTGCTDSTRTEEAVPDTLTHDTAHPDPADLTTASGRSRPATRTDTLVLEGMPQPVQVRLLEKNLPFSTYVPDEEMKVERTELEEGTSVRFIANFGGRLNPDAYLSIFIPDTPLTVEQMEDYVASEHGVIRSNGWRLVRTTTTPQDCPWAESSYLLQGSRERRQIRGSACIGLHAGTPFYVMMAYPLEYAEGFVPRAEKILGELRWNDTGKGLARE